MVDQKPLGVILMGGSTILTTTSEDTICVTLIFQQGELGILRFLCEAGLRRQRERVPRRIETDEFDGDGPGVGEVLPCCKNGFELEER